MVNDPTRPGTEERYAQAIESSDLLVTPERCSTDYLIAAGWAPDTLGLALFRLRSEWDTTRAELRQAEDNARNGARRAVMLEKHADSVRVKGIAEKNHDRGQSMLADALATRENAARLKAETEAAALTARALVLAHLKTLAGTRQAVYAYAIAHGARQRFYNLSAIRAVTGRALQLWLDPNCPHCEGRSFVGGFTEPMRWCQECIHTGRRINGRPGFRLGKNDVEHQFGRGLLVEMDRKSERTMASMRRFLNDGRATAAQVGPAELRGIKERLQTLRSTEAERD